MAYCIVSDVQAQIPKVDLSASTSKPNATDVGGYIAFCDAQIRGVLLKAGYDPDPVDVHALDYLKMTCVLGASSLAERAAFPGKDVWKELWDMYQDNLKSIADGSAPGLTSATGAAQALPESLYTVDPSAVVDPHFEIGSVQW